MLVNRAGGEGTSCRAKKRVFDYIRGKNWSRLEAAGNLFLPAPFKSRCSSRITVVVPMLKKALQKACNC